MESKLIELPLKGSQYGQSTFIGDILFRGVPGYFVDVGARCGKIFSNTLRLENMGWEGICIEPHPDLFEKCSKSRRCLLINNAVSSRKSKLEFVKFLEEPYGNSGLLETFPNIERLKSINHIIIGVEAKTLTEILLECKAPNRINYLDIDTEGHEVEVLRGTDFDCFRFDYIGVEAKYGSKHYKDIEKVLNDKGYKIFCNVGSDCFFTEFI